MRQLRQLSNTFSVEVSDTMIVKEVDVIVVGGELSGLQITHNI